jgi:hypothetical protein
MPPAPRPPAQRFWEKVDKTGDCWLWTAGLWGSNKRFQYGKFFDGSKHITAHRFALAESLGRPLGKNQKALHHCDNCLCVRPDHLFEGTQLDNIRDMARKGRGKKAWIIGDCAGEKNAHAKLTRSQVEEIRSKAGTLQQAQIGELYGIKQAQVSKIVRRSCWAF